ncbi:MAG: hypothetical protein U0869_22340 [Chloroflexota bacterium]
MTMKLYRPTPDGGLEPAPVEAKDYRRKLRSRRWDAAELANPEADKTHPAIGIAFFLGLAVLTFIIIVGGYALGIFP